MAQRESWTVDLKCPQCGVTGSAEISENNRMYTKLDRDVDISGPFTAIDQFKIECDKCKVVVNGPKK